MEYTINHKNGKVLDVTCGGCSKLLPFTQPELSTDIGEATVFEHACPPQILHDIQDAIAEQSEQGE